MKNTIIYIMLISLVVFSSCQKDEFDYKLYVPTVEEIDSLYFSAGSQSLLSDGHAKLTFIVEAFRKVEMSGGKDGPYEQYVPVDIKQLPKGSIKIKDETGQEQGWEYSTSEVGTGTKSFYATLGELRSATKEVTILEPQQTYTKKYVDVIFHIFELKESDPSYDPLSYKEITIEQIEKAMADMNKVFNREITSAPNSGSANVEFRFATKDVYGRDLEKPGYHRINYDISIASGSSIQTKDFTNYVDANNRNIWNTEAYLNVFVIPGASTTGLGAGRPVYQYVEADGEAMPGMGTVTNDPAYEIEKTFRNTCAAVPRSLFFPGKDSRTVISGHIADFYGVFGTSFTHGVPPYVPPHRDDYCEDTQNFYGTDQVNELLKVDVNGDKFYSENVMDNRSLVYPSYRNHLTINQCERIRYAMVNCPGRNNGLTE